MKIMTAILFLILSACASVETKPAPPAWSMRTFRIAKEVAGTIYQWEVCTKTGLGGRCREWSITKELYDFNDPVTKQKFIDTEVECRVSKPLVVPTP